MLVCPGRGVPGGETNKENDRGGSSIEQFSSGHSDTTFIHMNQGIGLDRPQCPRTVDAAYQSAFLGE